MLVLVIAIVALLHVIVFKVAKDIYVYFIADLLGHCVDLKRVGGDWAVVTGAGDGIGRGYALALAQKGLNVCLIGRTKSKLEKVAAEISELTKSTSRAKTLVIQHDFSSRVPDHYKEKLTAELRSILPEIGVLVNNVGTAGTEENFGASFMDAKPDIIDAGLEMVDVNVASRVLMTGLLLPHFIAKNKGVIINISSVCSMHATRGIAVYAATKAFDSFFSDALRQECSAHTNIIVQTVTPALVRTKLVPKVADDTFPSLVAPTPEAFGRSALKTIGFQSTTYGCFQHSIQGRLAALCLYVLPGKAVSNFLYLVMTLLKRSNVKYLAAAKSLDADKSSQLGVQEQLLGELRVPDNMPQAASSSALSTAVSTPVA